MLYVILIVAALIGGAAIYKHRLNLKAKAAAEVAAGLDKIKKAL